MKLSRRDFLKSVAALAAATVLGVQDVNAQESDGISGYMVPLENGWHIEAVPEQIYNYIIIQYTHIDTSFVPPLIGSDWRLYVTNAESIKKYGHHEHFVQMGKVTHEAAGALADLYLKEYGEPHFGFRTVKGERWQ
jgi:hypothetical protein